MYELNICHIYPDILDLYADSGNIRILQKRMQWRGLKTNYTTLSLGDPIPADSFDLFFLGSGLESDLRLVLPDFLKNKAPNLISAIENDAVVLAIGTGFQLLGRQYTAANGEVLICSEALDITTAHIDRVQGRYLLKRADGKFLSGYENHSFSTQLGNSVKPFAEVLIGVGNDTEDKVDGVQYRNTFCTYCQGPLLATGPAFADALLTLALNRRYGNVTLSPLDDTLENQALHHIYPDAK